MSFVTVFCFWLSFLSVHCATYVWIPENDEVLTNCPDNPNGLESLFDLSNFSFVRVGDDIIHVEGDAKVIWDVEPTDRVMGRISAYRFERGAWQPTVINAASHNLCANFYEEGQTWYIFWTKYIKNKDDKKNCINRKGSILSHEPFDLEMKISGIQSNTLAGRYKTVITLTAIDKMNVPRKNSVCMELISEAFKI